MFQVRSGFGRVIVWLLVVYSAGSGLFKLNDPLGYAYQLKAYFGFLGLDFLSIFATSLALIIGLMEFVMAIALALGWHRKRAVMALGALQILAIAWALVSLIVQKELGCGCYGEALYLASWQILLKDLLLGFMIWIAWKYSPTINIHNFSENSKKKALYVLIFSGLCIGLLAINFLPWLDFSSYKVGNNLAEMAASAKGDAKLDPKYTLKNIQTGEQKTWTVEDYIASEIWKNKDWVVDSLSAVDGQQKLVSPVSGLRILDAGGSNYTAEILGNPFHNMIIVAPSLENANQKAIGNINALALNLVAQYNTRTVLLTASTEAEVDVFMAKNSFFPEVFYVESAVAKSLVRANPGILFLEDGVLLEKWHFNQMPSFTELTEKYFLPKQ